MTLPTTGRSDPEHNHRPTPRPSDGSTLHPVRILTLNLQRELLSFRYKAEMAMGLANRVIS